MAITIDTSQGLGITVDPSSSVAGTQINLVPRLTVYEGNAQPESVFGHVFDDHAGVFAIGSLNVTHDVAGQEGAGEASVGGWTHSGTDRSGVYGVYDVLYHLHPKTVGDTRSIQAFVRGGWSPEERGEIGTYVGGGLTAHGFIVSHNTIGVGFGHVRNDEFGETFVELFYKWRVRPWLSIEPDMQFYDTADRSPVR